MIMIINQISDIVEFELFWYPSPDDGYWNWNVNVYFTS